MEINKNTGKTITLEEAVSFTHSFQSENINEIKSFFVGSETLKKILTQEGCIGLRIYNGYDASANKSNRVLVGVDEMGEDISDGVIVDYLEPCPIFCPNSSPLIRN